MRAFIAGFLLIASYPAFAADCPISTADAQYLEEVGKTIRGAKNCIEASRLAELCAAESSLDTQFTIAAERQCGRDFWHKLSKSEKKSYSRLQAKCDSKYRGMEGTMYLSRKAFCRLRVARLYSELYNPPE